MTPTGSRSAAAAIAPCAMLLGAIVLGTSCSAPASRYRDDAERFLASDEMFQQYGVDLSEITCDEPAAVDTGTSMRCEAEGDDGHRYAFTFVVTGAERLTLESIEFASASGPADTDVA